MCRSPVLLGSLALCAALGGASEPTPTPPPSSLARLAGRLELDRSALGGEGAVVITNDNLADLAAAGRLSTTAGVKASPPPPAATPSPRDQAALRERWRTAYRRQRERVFALEEQLVRLDLEVAAAAEADRSRPPGSARRPDRAPVLRQRREALAARVDRERSELRRIVREARADGAQPGWFR